MKTLTTKFVVAALAATLSATVAPVLTAEPAAAVTTTYVDKRTVVTEKYDAPMKTVNNSSTSIASMQGLIDDWIAKRSLFKYGNYENLFKAGSQPVKDANGLYDLDCSSWLQAVLEGIKYDRSRYVTTTNSSDFGATMPFYTLTQSGQQNRRMLSDGLAKWAYQHGYWFGARPDFSNVRVGDVLFWHGYPTTDSAGNPIFKQVSHAAFVTKVLPDGYFEVADCTEVTTTQKNLISRRTLHAADLHRLQVYSAARFPLDKMWNWEYSANQNSVNRGWTWDFNANRFTYLNESTGAKPAANSWLTIDGKKYWFDANGFAVFGTPTINGVLHYISENHGDVPYSTWQTIQNTYYNYFGDGSRKYDHFTTATRGWQKIDGAWYYFIPTTGWMVRDGWQSIYEPTLGRSSWNYCKHNGQCIDQLKTENGMTFMSLAGPADYARGWYTVNGYTRYFRETTSASMATGFQKINNNWYYLRENTGTKAYGWQYVNTKWRFLDQSSGIMKLAGTHYIIDSYDVITWDSTYGYYSVPKTIVMNGVTYRTLAGPYRYA